MTNNLDHKPMVLTGSYALWAELTRDLWMHGYGRNHPKWVARKVEIAFAIDAANGAIKRMVQQ